MIEAIYRSIEHKGFQEQMSQAELVAGKGIVGDRNFDKSKWPGQNITFIEQEEIDHFNTHYQQTIAQSATRRNVVTKDVRLNELVGKTFTIGEVQFYGVELCEPCRFFGEFLMENSSMVPADIVKAFVHRGGLRANILNDGYIAVGMSFNL